MRYLLTLLILCFGIIISLSSCGTHKYTNIYSSYPGFYHSKTEIPEGEKSSLIFNSISGYDGKGRVVQIQGGYTERLCNQIREYQIFEQVLYNTNVSGINNLIMVDVKLVEDLNQRIGVNALKSYLIGSSLFTLYPFINLKSDYSLELEFIFTKGEEVRVITTKCSKELSRKGLYMKENVVDLVDKVLLELNKDLENKIRADLDFFTMQSDKNINYVSTEISAPPSLIVDNIVFKDFNSNNLLEADEQATISFNIKNIGKGSAHGINIQIKDNNNTQGLTYDRSKQINILKPESVNIITIQIDASMELATDTSSFKITISEGNGFDIDPIELSISTQSFIPPNIEIVDYVFISDVGQMKLGEKVNLQFALQNLGQGVAEDINISLFIPDNVFAADETNYSINKLNPGEKNIYDFSFFTNKRFSNEVLNITANISEKYDKYAIDKTMSVKMEEDISNAIALKVESSVTIENITIDRFSLTSHVDKNIPINNKVNNRFALVIGNEDYTSSQRTLSSEQNVDYAINDATIFKKYCLSTFGVREENMFSIINATAGEMSQKIDLLSKILSIIDSTSELIVYYAGHGYPQEVTEVPYLIPVDVSASNLRRAIKLDDFYQQLANTNTSKITIFLDACFTGGGRNLGLVASRGVKVKPKEGTLNGNIVVFSASSAEQSSLPYHDEGHGIFTYFLLKKFQETNGNFTLGELSEYLEQNVSIKSLRVNQKEQDPTVNTSSKVVNDWRNWKF